MEKFKFNEKRFPDLGEEIDQLKKRRDALLEEQKEIIEKIKNIYLKHGEGKGIGDDGDKETETLKKLQEKEDEIANQTEEIEKKLQGNSK